MQGADRAGESQGHAQQRRVRQVRIFLSCSLERATSSEFVLDAHSTTPTLFDPPAMKLSLRSAFLVFARLGESLQSLQESLRAWAPQLAPVLVPIPIQPERRVRGTAGPRDYRRS